ncbi:MAG: hypothetical protein H8E97_06710 [Bacteroidetes bacterium]|nr:hypothetical protein [Bacteroidota bacterium]
MNTQQLGDNMAKSNSKWNSLESSKDSKVQRYSNIVTSMSKEKQDKLFQLWSLMQEFVQDHVVAKAIVGVLHGSTISQGRKAEHILKGFLSKCENVNSVKVDVPSKAKIENPK